MQSAVIGAVSGALVVGILAAVVIVLLVVMLVRRRKRDSSEDGVGKGKKKGMILVYTVTQHLYTNGIPTIENLIIWAVVLATTTTNVCGVVPCKKEIIKNIGVIQIQQWCLPDDMQNID